MTLRIRIARDTDQAFIVDAWRRSFEGSLAVRGADRDHYRVEMTRAIRRILDGATALVACDPTDEDTLVGFCAFTGSELHYVYVKQDFRGHGIARDLLKGVPITSYTFVTQRAKPPKDWRYTPRFTL